jgi:uncharacterized protein (DUF1501 family)
MNKFNRRNFLKLGCRTIVGAGLMSSTAARLANAQSSNDYRALVCINLDGGNDGFNMLVPSTGAAYSEYKDSRRHLAVGSADLTALSPATANTTPVGLNPFMQKLKPLFDQGNLAFQANVGTMIEPTTPDDVRNESVRLPEQLFSHHDQARQWQKLDHYHTWNSGWGARAADIFAAQQAYPNLAAISLVGSNEWQAGGEQSAFTISSEGVSSYAGMEDLSQDSWQMPRRQAFIELLNQQYENVFERSYAELQSRALVLSTNVGAALARLGELQTPVPENNRLAQQLAMVAKLIAIKDEFRMTRQLFYVNLSGFDTHDDQLRVQPYLYSQVADALAFFHQALLEINQLNNVTSFTTSDFGRSVTGNGDGTDHGWGNHHIVMGGAVHGTDVYGTMPRVTVDGPDDYRNGRIVPTTAVSQYAATHLRWLGLDEADIDNLLPSLKNFQTRDLGFYG